MECSWLSQSHYVPELQAHVTFDPEILSIDMYSKEIREGREEVRPEFVVTASFNGAVQKPGHMIIDWLCSYA